MPAKAQRGPFRLVPYFSDPSFDRAIDLRADAGRLAALKRDPRARFVPLWHRRHLVTAEPSTRLARLTLAELGVRLPDLAECPVFVLGRDDAGALLGCDLSALDTPPCPTGHFFRELSPDVFAFDEEDAALAAQLRITVLGNELPHVAAVVLPVTGERVLLARARGAANPRHLTALTARIAPGEMLEQAAARQVLADTGVSARRLQYHSSQVWPFPNTMLCGFHLLAKAETLVQDRRSALAVSGRNHKSRAARLRSSRPSYPCRRNAGALDGVLRYVRQGQPAKLARRAPARRLNKWRGRRAVT